MKIDWYRLITPSAWVQNEPTCWLWDKKLNELMDNYPIEYINEFIIKIGPTKVWVGNYPYSFGHPHRQGYNFLPSMKTRKRLREKVSEETVNRIISGL